MLYDVVVFNALKNSLEVKVVTFSDGTDGSFYVNVSYFFFTI